MSNDTQIVQTLVDGAFTHQTKQVGPGVWEHTYTPATLQDPVTPPVVVNSPAKEAIERLLAAYGFSDMRFFVSPALVKRLHHIERLKRLYHAHPLPRRRIRKCHLRKRAAMMRQCKAHIQRVEQRRAEREAVMMGGAV